LISPSIKETGFFVLHVAIAAIVCEHFSLIKAVREIKTLQTRFINLKKRLLASMK